MCLICLPSNCLACTSSVDQNAPAEQKHLLCEFFCAPAIFSKPYSNSCNPPRWHRPSMQPFRMHQCPQMPAQSQNTDSKGLRVISHSVMILFRNNMDLGRSLGWLQRKKKKKTSLLVLKFYFMQAMLWYSTCRINANVLAHKVRKLQWLWMCSINKALFLVLALGRR